MTEEQHDTPTTAAQDSNGDSSVEESPANPTLAELKNQYLRLAAEFDNYRKRVQRDREEQRLRDRDELIIDWLEVVDNIERGVNANAPDAATWLEGTKAIHRQMLALLQKYQVRAVNPLGQRFDPNRHDAVGTVAMPGAEPGHVIHTDRPGYERPDRILRPARVVVAAEEA